MWNSLASSLLVCRAHDSEACEKPWMNRISGPAGLPQSCTAMETPSGARATSDLYGVCWAWPGAEIATMVFSSPYSTATAHWLAPPGDDSRRSILLLRGLPEWQDNGAPFKLPGATSRSRVPDVASWRKLTPLRLRSPLLITPVVARLPTAKAN